MIRGRVIENTQRVLTQRTQLPREGVCVRLRVRDHVFMSVCVSVQRIESPDEQRFELRKRQTHSA